MAISKRKGIMKISKYIYDLDSMDTALSKLEVKIYHIEYDSFNDFYTISFTSKYVDEIECEDVVPEYSIEISPRGFRFVG